MNDRPLPTTIDDSDRWYVWPSPICRDCRHRIGHGEFACAAFPGRIPLEIWNGERDHATPHPGDHGIRFAPKSEDDWARERLLALERAETVRRIVERVKQPAHVAAGVAE